MGNEQCEHEGCTKQASFNNAREKARRFCAAHKLDGMVNVKDKACEHDSCTKHPNFNNPEKRLVVSVLSTNWVAWST
jgi:hypothetical protein